MRTVTIYSIDGVSKAKTNKAILVSRPEIGDEAWIPLSTATVKFTGPNFKVRVSVPDWLYSKIVWKRSEPYVKPVKVETVKPVEVVEKPSEPVAVAKSNPYVGMDFGNLMEEQMVLSEILSHKQIEYGENMDSDDPAILEPLEREIAKIKNALVMIADAMKRAMEKA